MRQTLLFLLLVILPVIVSAETVEIDGINYKLDNEQKTAEVTQRYYDNPYSGDIIIPESIMFGNNRFSVTSIGHAAFSASPDLTSVTIPNSVNRIDDDAFNSCNNLISVTIPNSVRSIGRKAFLYTAWYNKQPNGVVYAGKVAYTFKGTMPNNTNIILEEGTLAIADEAFICCDGLTSIIIPSSVTNIGNGAFWSCKSLGYVEIPSSITEIEDHTFQNCVNLTHVTIPNSVKRIGNNAFAYCI